MSVNSAAGETRSGAVFRAATAPTRVQAWASGLLAAEADRLFLWLPVFFGAGILIYFDLRAEPWPFFGWVAAFAASAVFLVARRNLPAMLAAAAVLAMCLGFAAAQARTSWVAAPRLAQAFGPATVSGTVETVQPNGSAWRVVLSDLDVAGLATAATPGRVRVSVRGVPPDPGARVRLRARLMPPPAPALPGGFDFQQQAWFAGLGAVGYALGRVDTVAPPASGGLGTAVAAVRQRIDARIAAILDGDRGALASALVTGLRGRVSEETLTAMRDSGLAHLLAISGLHMSLVAGFVFFAVRAGLAGVPPLALRWQTRKVAAIVALAFAGGYLLLSGATVPTQRAFVMLLLALVAILADRLEVSMRPIALAALLVMLLAPETVTGPSFQLSFAAVVALVAAYEGLRRRTERRAAAGLPPHSRIWTYPAALLFTSVVATVATVPFAVHHFNQAALYAVAANLVAVPVTGMWVMPMGIVALLAMPVGLEALPLHAMAAGIDVIAWAARETASWPGAVMRGLAPPGTAVALVAAGGLWLCLWRSSWRMAGVPAMVAGLAMAGTVPPPDVVLSDDGRLSAVRDADGTLLVSSMRAGAFERAAWMRRTGAEEAAAWPDSVSAGGAMRCDSAACVYERSGRTVAFIRHEDAVANECASADLVVVEPPVSSRLLARACPGNRLIRYRDLKRDGAHIVRMEPAGLLVETVRDRRGDRPWTGRGTATSEDQ